MGVNKQLRSRPSCGVRCVEEFGCSVYTQTHKRAHAHCDEGVVPCLLVLYMKGGGKEGKKKKNLRASVEEEKRSKQNATKRDENRRKKKSASKVEMRRFSS